MSDKDYAWTALTAPDKENMYMGFVFARLDTLETLSFITFRDGKLTHHYRKIQHSRANANKV